MKDRYELKDKENELWGARGEGEGDPIIAGKIDAIQFLLGDGDPITDEDIGAPTTDEELDKLIAILKAEKENIPEYSMFGDPNWKVADAQIEICEWAKGGK